jgi:hypothetical protein
MFSNAHASHILAVDIVQQHRSSELARARAFENQPNTMAHAHAPPMPPSAPHEHEPSPAPASAPSNKSTTVSGSRKFEGIPIDPKRGIPDPKKRRQHAPVDVDVQMGQAMVHAYRSQTAASHASLEQVGHGRTTSAGYIQRDYSRSQSHAPAQRPPAVYADLPAGSRDTVPGADSGYVMPRNSGVVEPERQRRVMPEVPRKEIRFSSDDVVRAVEQQSAARDQAMALRGLR